MAKIKKIRLPPTNLEGVETFLRNKGYCINPILQGENPRAKLTFDKPLPDGRRLHGSVFGGKGKFHVKQHIDSHDPYRNPIGHCSEIMGLDTVLSLQLLRKEKRKDELT